MASIDDNEYIKILKDLPIHVKLNSAFELFDLAKIRIGSQIKKENPLISQSQIDQKVIARLLATK